MNEVKNHWKKWLYWFTLAVAIILVYKASDNFSNIWSIVGKLLNVLGPFFAGIFIAYLLYLPCKKIETLFKKSKIKLVSKKSRTLSIAIVYIIAIILLIIVINFIIPVLSESIAELFANLQGYYQTTINNFNSLPEDSLLKSEYIKNFITSLQNIDLKQYFNFDSIMQYAKNAIDAVTSIFDIFVAFIVSIYILSERNQILNFVKKFIKAHFKSKTYENFEKYFNRTNEIFFKFISAQFLDAIIIGILTTIAMSIMGIKYAPLLGFTIGLFNIIPYIGAIIAVIISAIITLITGGLSQAIWMIIVVTIIQQIDANIINPKLIGGSLEISPLLVLLAVTIGGAFWGILGMFLAVPVIAVVKIIVEDSINSKL